MTHFLDITQLTVDDIERLVARARWFKQATHYPIYSHAALANLFYENSTRTRASFELAAQHLGLRVVHMDMMHSSESKGEDIHDTLKTLASMGINVASIRHSKEHLPAQMADTAPTSLHIINAGDGTHAHPSQAMLDLMTVMEKKSNIAHLKIAIVGDLRHSRVANSLQHVCALFQVNELMLVGPELWLPNEIIYGKTTTSLQEGLMDADVVVALRVQRERLMDDEQLDLNQYRRDYAITTTTLLHAKQDVMVMHPGPVNRGIEIDSDVVDGKHSSIWEQVTNGVFMRMAIIEYLIK
jgi:aspartate carbamoyltransferase catalytic subunit